MVSFFNKEELITEILLKNGFKLNDTLTKQEQFTRNEILLATDGDKQTLVCLDVDLAEEKIENWTHLLINGKSKKLEVKVTISQLLWLFHQ